MAKAQFPEGLIPVAIEAEARVREFLPPSGSLCLNKAEACSDLCSCGPWTAARAPSVLNVLISFCVNTVQTWDPTMWELNLRRDGVVASLKDAPPTGNHLLSCVILSHIVRAGLSSIGFCGNDGVWLLGWKREGKLKWKFAVTENRSVVADSLWPYGL